MGLKKINAIRKKSGMSLYELSEKSGVPLGTLSKITAGITADPKIATLQAIAKALSCTIDDFIGDEEEQSEQIEKPSLTNTDEVAVALINELSNKIGKPLTIRELELFDGILDAVAKYLDGQRE